MSTPETISSLKQIDKRDQFDCLLDYLILHSELQNKQRNHVFEYWSEKAAVALEETTESIQLICERLRELAFPQKLLPLENQ